MGKKYASLHIFDGEQEKNLLIIKDFYNNDNSMELAMQHALNIFENAEARQMFERFSQLSETEILIIQSETFISIYDEAISFETVEEKAEALSNKIDEPIIYTSNFDGDVFIFGVYQSGKLVTSGKVGKGLSEYGIAPEFLDIDKFCNELSLKRTDSMECLITSEKINDIEKEIEKVLQVPLKLTFRDIQYDYEHFIEKSIENGVYIFEKI